MTGSAHWLGMFGGRRCRLGVLLACMTIAVPSTAVPPLDAYGHLPSADLIAVSPNGSAIALALGDEQNRQIQIRRTADLKMLDVIVTGRTKVRSLQWAGENHLVIASSATAAVFGMTGPKREYMTLLDYNLATKKPSRPLDQPLSDGPRKMNVAADIPVTMVINGKPIAFVEGISFPNNEGVLTLYRVDLDTGRTNQIAVGSPDTQQWLIDNAGSIAARVDYAQAAGRWTLWTSRDGRLIKSLVDTHPIDSPSLTGFGRSAGTLMIGVPNEDEPTFRELTLGDDHMSAPVAELAGGTPIEDPGTKRVIGVVRYDGMKVSYTFFDASDARLWLMIGKSFPDALVQIESWSDDRSKIVLRVEGQGIGAAFFLLDVTARHASRLADEYSGIGASELAEKTIIAYPAADGLQIPAYITMPVGSATKMLPLVVLVHGGPASRDEPGFDWWSQALASRGYVVLQPQFRGSSGFGERFLTAGYGEWGRKMQSDVSDGVAYLAAKGTIDPARVCIVGGSYGGYAALAGVTMQTGIYRCAVSLAGPADLRAMLSWEQTMTGGARNRSLRHWQRFMGAASPSDPSLDAISPAKLASRVTAPVLLIHGLDDTVVPFAQSQAMANALSRAGKSVQLVQLKGEDHWLSRSETRTEMLRATDAFLATNLALIEGDKARPQSAKGK